MSASETRSAAERRARALELFPAALRGRMTDVHPLSQGAFGVVFRARDRLLGRVVAVKVLRPGCRVPTVTERFRREARMLAKVRHPGVVQVLDVWSEGHDPYILQEFVHGRSLSSRLARGPRPRPEEVATWGAQVAEALEAIHEVGLLHRDVKPGNLVFREGRELVLCDFGLARDQKVLDRLTATGVAVGTPSYMAPEVWQLEPHGPAADQWSLGAALYRALLGRKVFEDAGLTPIAFALGEGEVPMPEPAEDPAPGLSAHVARALRRDPEERFPDLEGLARALRHWRARGHRRPARPTQVPRSRVVSRAPAPPPLPRLARRSLALSLGVLALAVASLQILSVLGGEVPAGAARPGGGGRPASFLERAARLRRALAASEPLAPAEPWTRAARALTRPGLPELWEQYLQALGPWLERSDPGPELLLEEVADTVGPLLGHLHQLLGRQEHQEVSVLLGIDGGPEERRLWARWGRVRGRYRAARRAAVEDLAAQAQEPAALVTAALLAPGTDAARVEALGDWLLAHAEVAGPGRARERVLLGLRALLRPGLSGAPCSWRARATTQLEGLRRAWHGTLSQPQRAALATWLRRVVAAEGCPESGDRA